MCLLLEEAHKCKMATYFRNWLSKLNWWKWVNFKSIIWFPSLENMQMRLWKLKQRLLPRLLQHKPKAFIWMDNRLPQIGSAGVWSLEVWGGRGADSFILLQYFPYQQTEASTSDTTSWYICWYCNNSCKKDLVPRLDNNGFIMSNPSYLASPCMFYLFIYLFIL